jgi:predicted DNA binding CopG/RHH family protein
MTAKARRIPKISRKRVTVYVDPDIHKAVRLKAAETERPYSTLVNEALRRSLAEDAEDLAAITSRAKAPSMPFEEFVKDLKRRGKL